MPTKNFVPRNTDEGTLGTSLKRWLGAFVKTITIGGGSFEGKATVDQAVAGTDDVNIMTPLKVKAAIDNLGITWRAGANVVVGHCICDIGIENCVAMCSIPGVTGTTKPSFGSSRGATITDGTVSWIILAARYKYDENRTTGYTIYKSFNPNTGLIENDIVEWGNCYAGIANTYYDVSLPITYPNEHKQFYVTGSNTFGCSGSNKDLSTGTFCSSDSNCWIQYKSIGC